MYYDTVTIANTLYVYIDDRGFTEIYTLIEHTHNYIDVYLNSRYR